MKTGLTKLVEAQESVDLLRQELAEKEKEILVATEAAEKVLKHITTNILFNNIYRALGTTRGNGCF